MLRGMILLALMAPWGVGAGGGEAAGAAAVEGDGAGVWSAAVAGAGDEAGAAAVAHAEAAGTANAGPSAETAAPSDAEGAAPWQGPASSACLLPPASDYYVIALVPTRQVTGTGRSEGTARTSFASTPFGVSVAEDGSYRTTLHVQVNHLPARAPGSFTAWATTPDIDAFQRIGVLDADGYVEGPVDWNKFLVVVTLEPEDAPEEAEMWSGPIVLRGMSRSGMMHTMAGHGPFEQVECAAFGY